MKRHGKVLAHARAAVSASAFFSLAACLWLSQPSMSMAQSAPTTESASIDRLIESLSSTQTLQADFRQTTAAAAGASAAAKPVPPSAQSARNRVASGSFSISRPGLLRWEVAKPYAQLQLLDGEQFWLYDPDLAQASVRPMSVAKLSGLAGLLLNSTGLTRAELAKRYALAALPDRDNLSWIQMTPNQPEQGVAKIVVAIDREAMLRQIEITDALGQVTRIELSNVQKNIVINPANFRFVLPKGVSVLRAP